LRTLIKARRHAPILLDKEQTGKFDGQFLPYTELGGNHQNPERNEPIIHRFGQELAQSLNSNREMLGDKFDLKAWRENIVPVVWQTILNSTNKYTSRIAMNQYEHENSGTSFAPQQNGGVSFVGSQFTRESARTVIENSGTPYLDCNDPVLRQQLYDKARYDSNHQKRIDNKRNKNIRKNRRHEENRRLKTHGLDNPNNPNMIQVTKPQEATSHGAQKTTEENKSSTATTQQQQGEASSWAPPP